VGVNLRDCRAVLAMTGVFAMTGFWFFGFLGVDYESDY